MIEIRDIQDKIKEWVDVNLPGFSFRKHQLESITSIISNIENNNTETTIIEAPTGSGKSLICLIAAGVLAEYFKKDSYILCSDLYLWKQYADFIDDKKLPFGKLKGSKGNYTCTVNGQDLSISYCKLKGTSYGSLMNSEYAVQNGFACALKCEYIRNRKRAISAKVTLMTYQLWLNYLNYTDGEIFGKRSVIFCDECHNIPKIIQMFCQPSINPKYHFPYFEEVVDYAIDNNYVLSLKGYTPDGNLDEEKTIKISEYFTIQQLHKDLTAKFEKIFDTDDKSIILQEYSDYFRIVTSCAEIADKINTDISGTAKKQKTLSKNEQKILKAAGNVIEYKNSLFDFMRAVSMCGDECLSYLVKTNTLDKDMNRSVVFACSKEDLLCNEYMLKNSPYKVMLSATVGAHEAFDENIGVKFTMSKCSDMLRIPSTFDFSKSPIYFLPKYRMSKGYIEQNFPIMKQLIQSIISSPKHLNEKGIIHTGSYKNALQLYQMMPDEIRDRLYIYGSAKEKDDSLSNFELSDNGILLGPTLTEGIDLPDDGCRFIIIMKIPYPSLGDNLVLSKIKLFPKWYNSETSNTVIQAIGRGNRTPDDWCTTYILDGNFGQLYTETQSQYPPELQARIKYINA